MNFRLTLLSLASLIFLPTIAQSGSVKYIGDAVANVDYTHGQITPAVGVHNTQLFRANRIDKQEGDRCGFTYHHAPMICYWNDKYYVQWLGGAVGEHIPPSQSYIMTSTDGYKWEQPTVVFPPYEMPAGIKKPGIEGETKQGQGAIMHQRMSFYVTKNNKLLVTGFYGFTIKDDEDMPCDGTGVGRVVREMKQDGTMGEIYFLKYNPKWNEKNTHTFKYYKRSKDWAFVRACDELLANRLITQQWNDELDPNDPAITVPPAIHAMCYYTLTDSRVVAIGKKGKYCLSSDQGKSWTNAAQAEGVFTGGAKVWGQRTSDNKYALVYDASMFRWPMTVVTSEDGLTFDNMLLLQGEITPKRYAGQWKDYGPQYFRGIIEGNGTPPDGKMWITYSMNKEDIWVASANAPITSVVEKHEFDNFDFIKHISDLSKWNLHSACWASVSLTESNDMKWLQLTDKDRYEYAKAERIIPRSTNLKVGYIVKPVQNGEEHLCAEIQNDRGIPSIRIDFALNGEIMIKTNDEPVILGTYKTGEEYDVELSIHADRMMYSVNINGIEVAKEIPFNQPSHTLQRVVFRTGVIRREPNPESQIERPTDLPQSEVPVKEAIHLIRQVWSESL